MSEEAKPQILCHNTPQSTQDLGIGVRNGEAERDGVHARHELFQSEHLGHNAMYHMATTIDINQEHDSFIS